MAHWPLRTLPHAGISHYPLRHSFCRVCSRGHDLSEQLTNRPPAENVDFCMSRMIFPRNVELAIFPFHACANVPAKNDRHPFMECAEVGTQQFESHLWWLDESNHGRAQAPHKVHGLAETPDRQPHPAKPDSIERAAGRRERRR